MLTLRHVSTDVQSKKVKRLQENRKSKERLYTPEGRNRKWCWGGLWAMGGVFSPFYFCICVLRFKAAPPHRSPGHMMLQHLHGFFSFSAVSPLLATGIAIGGLVEVGGALEVGRGGSASFSPPDVFPFGSSMCTSSAFTVPCSPSTFLVSSSSSTLWYPMNTMVTGFSVLASATLGSPPTLASSPVISTGTWGSGDLDRISSNSSRTSAVGRDVTVVTVCDIIDASSALWMSSSTSEELSRWISSPFSSWTTGRQEDTGEGQSATPECSPAEGPIKTHWVMSQSTPVYQLPSAGAESDEVWPPDCQVSVDHAGRLRPLWL